MKLRVSIFWPTPRVVLPQELVIVMTGKGVCLHLFYWVCFKSTISYLSTPPFPETKKHLPI